MAHTLTFVEDSHSIIPDPLTGRALVADVFDVITSTSATPNQTCFIGLFDTRLPASLFVAIAELFCFTIIDSA
jgi:hypothetical protein